MWRNSPITKVSNINIKFAYKPGPTIEDLFCHKSKINEMQKTGVVYGVYCPQCSRTEDGKVKTLPIYVGETAQSLQKRIYGHRNNHATKSSIRDHVLNSNHSWPVFRILKGGLYGAKERKIWERFYISKFKPILNGKDGQKGFLKF